MDMNTKEYVIITLRVIIYACTLVLAALGAVAMTSCTIQRESTIQGRAIIVTSDTTYINHQGTISFPKR